MDIIEMLCFMPIFSRQMKKVAFFLLCVTSVIFFLLALIAICCFYFASPMIAQRKWSCSDRMCAIHDEGGRLVSNRGAAKTTTKQGLFFPVNFDSHTIRTVKLFKYLCKWKRNVDCFIN